MMTMVGDGDGDGDDDDELDDVADGSHQERHPQASAVGRPAFVLLLA